MVVLIGSFGTIALVFTLVEQERNIKQFLKGVTMLQWALTFLVLALIAGFLGFGGVAVISVEMAKLLFGLFILLFIISAVVHAFRGRTPPI